MSKDEICKNCRHLGSMHSDSQHTHTGECFTEMGVGDNDKLIWCDCKEFANVLEDKDAR